MVCCLRLSYRSSARRRSRITPGIRVTPSHTAKSDSVARLGIENWYSPSSTFGRRLAKTCRIATRASWLSMRMSTAIWSSERTAGSGVELPEGIKTPASPSSGIGDTRTVSRSNRFNRPW
jgi:hypothetical protein